MPPGTTDQPLHFGRFEICPAERVVRVDGRPAALGARAFDLLLALAQRRERLVTKQELLDLVWPGLVVEEHNLTVQISSVRKLLGPHVIGTVPGRGYRFTATLDAPPDETQASTEHSSPPRHNLPEQRTRFIGRAAALADLARLLPQTRLLTLTGIGGCGKTRLALEFAQQRLADFADGVCFVDLAPLKESGRVAYACAAALLVDKAGEAPSAERLAQLLAERDVLIVLDNCEHVRDGAAALVDAVLAAPGRSRILATSREPLAVAGEQLYPVPSLSLPATPHLEDVLNADAARVFVDRIRLALPDFEIDAGNAAPVAEICRRLDGIALAIELAAARVPVLSVFEIAARLQDRFRLLTGGSAAAARQQTLLATMQWSYDLLKPAEQRMLCRMAVFAGGWTLDAAAAVGETADEYKALALLTALHDKSLVVVEPGAGVDGRPRYRMLETVREYAQQRIEESGDAAQAHRRHAEFFLALAESAAPHLRGPQQSLWMARLRAEQENLVAAMTWCAQQRAPVDPQFGLRLAAATGRYWVFHDIDLGRRLAEGALQRDRDAADSVARVDTLLGLASMCMHSGRGEEGLPQAQAALAAAERLASTERQAMALVAIGSCLGREGEEDEALQYYARALDLAQSGGHAVPLAAALNNIANIEVRRGQPDSAVPRYRQALHLSRARGDVRAALIELHNLVRALVWARRNEEAHACAVEAELLLRGVGESVLKLELIEVCAGLASSRGEHEFAARLWGAAVQRFADAGYRRPLVDDMLLVQWSAATRQALGDAAFDRAEAAGRALDLDAAMLELRRWLERNA